MKVAVWGLGYVGAVTAAALADLGHEVVGVERSPQKVARLELGYAPFVEPGLDELLTQGLKNGRLRVTTDCHMAQGCDVLLLCVGTPSGLDGAANLTAVLRVCNEVGGALRGDQRQVVVLRSTLPPPALPQVMHQLETICGDLAFLEKVWATEVRRGVQQPARVLAELREARRAAWAAGDLPLVLQALRQEAELMVEMPQAEPELFRLK